MALTFYYGAGSPYAWRVWLALEHKGIHHDFKVLSFSDGDLKQPEFLAINPRGRVPAIVDDGFALYESAAILEYLDERYDEEQRLFPGDVATRALVRRLIREADAYVASTMEALVGLILFTPRAEWQADKIAAAREAFGQELARWEKLVTGRYLAGSELSAADFTLYPMLALALRLEKKNPALDVRSLIGPRLKEWMERIEALPYFARTWPPHWT